MSKLDYYDLIEEFHREKYDAERDYILEKYNKEELSKEDVKEIFNKYALYQIARNNYWNYSQCIVNKDDNILFQINLRFNGKTQRNGYGQNWFHVYVIENNNKLFAKIIDIMPLAGIAIDCCRNFFKSHVAYVEEINVGINLKTYKDKVNELVQTIELDSEFYKLIEDANQIEFKESYLELFNCQYAVALCSMDIYDFINQKVFYADQFCLEKYKPLIDIVEYIFKKASFKNFEEMPMITIVDNLDLAESLAAKMFIDKEYHYYFDIL